MRAVHRPAAASTAPSAAPYAREHDDEPQPGLPEPLPASERVLWQGSPDWKRLARRAFHLRKLAIYFAAMVGLRAAFVIGDGGTALDALRSTIWPLALATLALSLVALLAWLSARGTVYTLTDKRVVMRIGIVLTLTFNLPYKRIAAAGLHLESDGTGDLPLTLLAGDHIAWLHLWPHARPWKLARPEPMLRSVPDAQRVARLLSQAWSNATGWSGTTAQLQPAERPSAHGAGQTALAGR
jgi:hypothetical protein